MNFVLSVNKNWVAKDQNEVNLIGNLEHLKQLTNNKVVVYNNQFLFKKINKNLLKNKICVCFSQNKIEEEKNVVTNLKDLFEFLSFYTSDNIFVLGDVNFIKSLLPYCKKAYITKIDKIAKDDQSFNNLDEDENWELLKTSDPLFEDGIMYYFCEYVNKNPQKFNYGYEEDDLI